MKKSCKGTFSLCDEKTNIDRTKTSKLFYCFNSTNVRRLKTCVVTRSYCEANLFPDQNTVSGVGLSDLGVTSNPPHSLWNDGMSTASSSLAKKNMHF